MRLDDHPTVKKVRSQQTPAATTAPDPLDYEWLKNLALESGADDAGLVDVQRPALDDQRADILHVFPRATTLLTFVCRMNREPIRSPARSLANLEFHHTGDQVNDVGRRITEALETRGIAALNVTMGFPMEMDRFPGKVWVVSHKPVAVAAGLGMMGIHRNVIHPKFSNFILLGTVLIAREATRYDEPLAYNPCLECKLCVAACPVGAISPDGRFDFSACYTHNYREFMGGFTDWVEQVAASRSATEYRQRVTDSESASMWQSLSFGANYKAAYCLAACPAGEDVIGPYLQDKREHLETVVRPLQAKKEPVYVVRGSDAEDHVRRRFPHKTIRQVRGSLRPRTIEGFLDGLTRTFQREKSTGLNATYQFVFTGSEHIRATVRISDRTIEVARGLQGTADLQVTADSDTWLGFIAKERSLLLALLSLRIRLWGSPLLLVQFGRCFPA